MLPHSLAALLGEADGEVRLSRLAEAGTAVMSSVNYWEALVRAHAVHGDPGHALMDRLMANFNISIAPVDASMAREAATAFARYRGRPARLNLADCFAYALAQHEGDGLLYKGDDFPKTDVKNALA